MTNRNIIVYISGKYSGNIVENIQTARRKAIEVWEAGFTALTPHLNTYHFEQDCKLTHDDYLEGDLQILQRCDCILMLNGWQDSVGATTEREFAKLNGIPIFDSVLELTAFYKQKVFSEL